MISNQLYFLITLFSINLLSVNGQATFLETTHEAIVGPENVNWLVEDQVDYYVNQYELHIDTLEMFADEYHADIAKIKTKRKSNNKKIKRINGYIAELEDEKKIVEHYIGLWKKLEFKNDYSKLSDLASGPKCYDILCGQKRYYDFQYEIVTAMKEGKVFWEEIFPAGEIKFINEKVVTHEAEEKWVKKVYPDCKSPNPDDCYIMCLVKVPERSHNERVQIGSLCEIKGFEYSRFKRACVREKWIISKLPAESKILVRDSATKELLTVSELIVIECD